MAITSEIIGKLGGAEVDSFPVSGAASGAANSEEILATVNVPAGETWLIAAIGDLTPRRQTSTLSPDVYLGNRKNNGWAGKGALSMAILGEGTITLRIKRNDLTGSDAFTGTVYTVKL